MFCFVDFRNRPQYEYKFRTRKEAREYLRKIENNPFGATVLFSDGRREYFEGEIPKNILKSLPQSARVRKGCHVKYKIRLLSPVDAIVAGVKTKNRESVTNWTSRNSSLLFMLGNRKFSACLFAISLTAFSFSFIFQRNLGQKAIAEEMAGSSGIVLGATNEKNADGPETGPAFEENYLELSDEDVIMSLVTKIDDKKNESFRKEILQYIEGKPMEDMAPYIARQPRIVAAFLVGIAMKESKFGVYAPHDANGRDCHNYWGYRGPENTTASGYSCFSSPEHAIQVVGKKINKLVAQGISNPAEMISWKCGSSCAGHGTENVRKWISDVGINFYKLNAKINS